MGARTQRTANRRLTARRAPALVAIAFGLNLVWEFAQAPLYSGRPPTAIYVRAAGVDALLILAAAALAGLVARLRAVARWPVLVGVLAVTAIVIELRALAAGRWSYAEAMPTLGPVGLSPLVQLPLLGALSVAAARRLVPAEPGISAGDGRARDDDPGNPARRGGDRRLR